MATLLLQAAGATVGGLFGPVGAMIGRAAGALAGNLIDRSIISGWTTVEGTPLESARIPGAQEGTPVSRVYGTARVGGTLIWATRFIEEVTEERSGGKATGPRIETFSYYANFAIGICEGPISSIRRIWADGRELDQMGIEMRVHRGGEDQEPDPLIGAKQGYDNTPTYRGLAYVVFERLPLDTFGNRIPVLQFEVIRRVGNLEKDIRAITIIPGATEHGYSPTNVTEELGDGEARFLNRNQLRNGTDWTASISELRDICPNLERVALVVSWFGDDLRAHQCQIMPGVEKDNRDGESVPWQVAGHTRGNARLISRVGGRPAYGGTPNDASVVAAIRHLKDAGLKVFLYPFLMMDIPEDNGLADPYGGSEGQSKYPWRGRITCHPAAGQPGSPDHSLEARGQINAFVGDAAAGDFDVSGDTVIYSGSDRGYRRMILHYALLAEAAGGVDGLIIGSELRGLTSVRDGTNDFPFVEKLAELAGDVRDITGNKTKLTYGADWSEYFGYHPQDGSGNVFFNLDQLWTHDAIDAVGIDNYMPLTDFRDEDFVGLQPDDARTSADKAAMTTAITSGEGFDWYYATDADRVARVRTPIVDGLAGKHWVYRYKDIEGWWSNRHYKRVGGVESASPTAWLAGMKPIWFTELGCPAIDRGGNQPNVFVDAKSSESALPYFSGGMRSDETQRRFLDAHHAWWNSDAAPAGMVNPGHMFLWAWDARAMPAFPEDSSLFADGGNWTLGHWLNGRLGGGTLSTVIAAILRDHGVTNFDVSGVSGELKGYVAGNLASARALLEPLVSAYRLDVTDIDGMMTFRSRGQISAPASEISVFADRDDEPRWTEMNGQDSDFASEAVIDFQGEADEYESQTARSRRIEPVNDRILRVGLPGVLPEESAAPVVEGLLRDHRLSRRQVRFSLPPTALECEPGDVITLAEGPAGRFVITRIEDGETRDVEARQTGSGDSASDYTRSGKRWRGRDGNKAFSPVIHLMDLARYEDGEGFARVAVAARPWKRVVLSVSPESENYQRRLVLSRPARMGRVTLAISGGVTGRIDEASRISVRMIYGGLSSVSELALLNGANRAAIKAASGEWEIIGFRSAEEVTENHWELSGLLRGLAGTEDAMAAGAAVSAPFVVLDEGVRSLRLEADEAGLVLNWLAEAAGSGGGSVGPVSFAGGVRSETPLSPVHLAAVRTGGGIQLIWVRRSRIAADGWEGDEIPLDEDVEAYQVEILNGGAPVRTVSANAPSFLYTSAMEIADFGGPQTVISFRVRQKGGKVALGIAAEANIEL
ncbi:glycoside hydrolase/phage tail family protein [Rhizobium sp. TH2]|uniref:baseplate multidomain protein megatron n=1 Tax=Rhizobium sp. TH2 TaxID=2775403 RepID=UPI0021581D32|nr:glycoside hydrolase/phage tail family protein [Rhizobium sp. TH2]UVC10358.1 glycoside hydrolase/phage tail family protein [Rhizobium sp. TH2]